MSSSNSAPFPIAGYVLAGGKSSRMGRNKSLLTLGGATLVQHAVDKLQGLCEQTSILSADPDLAPFAPLVTDLHPGCGPMSGMEAALAYSTHDWNLILPVDVPFVPASLLSPWIANAIQQQNARIAMFEVDGIRQPALLLIHRETLPYFTHSLAAGMYKVGPLLHRIADDLAAKLTLPPDSIFRRTKLASAPAIRHWFQNLNTPEDFAEAEKHLDALDT